MTIKNRFLNNIAKAMGGQTYSYPTHNLVATGDNDTINFTDESLAGEVGDRNAYTIGRTDNEITYSAIRKSTDVVGASSDTLTACGMDIGETGDNLQVGEQISETHTTNFDLEFEWVISFER